jgi:predicted acetyltransferase
MEIRKLRREEMPEAGLISVIAFHVRLQDIGTSRDQITDNYKNDNWGAFSEDGAIMARIEDARYVTRLDGHSVLTSGIAAVSTLPEYRVGGAVRNMFEVLLPAARKEGVVLSTLYPFNHAFYRKFGYELCYAKTEYELPVASLRGYRFGGWAKMWHPGETTELFHEVFEACNKNYNLAFVRDEEIMARHVRGEFWKDGKFCYLLGDEDGPCAYLCYDDVQESDGRLIAIEDCAFDGKRGLYALLGFLARFTADFKKVRIPMPSDIDLNNLVDDPYSVRTITNYNYMARVVDVPKALSLMKKPEGAAFTVAVADELVPENAGMWRVAGGKVEKTDAPADVELSVHALAPLIVGYLSLAEAELRPDVAVLKNRGTLERVFVKKPAFLTDHF